MIWEKKITIHDIDRTHRSRKRKLDNNVPRSISVKFARYNVRNRIFKTKKNLKEKNMSIKAGIHLYNLAYNSNFMKYVTNCSNVYPLIQLLKMSG